MAFKESICNSGRRSTLAGYSELLPFDFIDFAVLSLRDFWGETTL